MLQVVKEEKYMPCTPFMQMKQIVFFV